MRIPRSSFRNENNLYIAGDSYSNDQATIRAYMIGQFGNIKDTLPFEVMYFVNHVWSISMADIKVIPLLC